MDELAHLVTMKLLIDFTFVQINMLLWSHVSLLFYDNDSGLIDDR